MTIKGVGITGGKGGGRKLKNPRTPPPDSNERMYDPT
jgi:hypothetical protein